MKLMLPCLLAAFSLAVSADVKFPPLKAACEAALNELVDASLIKTAKTRRVLVFYRCEGFVHYDSIVTGNAAFRLAAERTKAFTVDFSQNYDDLRPENLKKYDVLVLNSTTGLKTKENAFLEPAFVGFVENGGGLLAIHAGADCWNDAPGAANVVGGLFAGHPWGAGGTWAFKVEDETSPLTQCFKAKKFQQGEEIYQHKSPPFHRAKLHVLVSLDMDDPVTNGVKGKIRPEENDYPVSWVRPYGKGRVFYTSFGHDTRAWTTEQTLRHIFAGLAFASGDLPADMVQPGVDLETLKKMDDPVRIGELLRDIMSHGGSAELTARTAKLEEGLLADSKVPKNVRDGAERALRGHTTVLPHVDGHTAALQGVTPWATVEAAAVAELKRNPNAFATLVKNADERIRLAVIGSADKTPTAQIAAAYAPAPTTRTKAALLTRLAERKAPETAALAGSALNETDETLICAALGALRTCGTVADVEKIIPLLKREGRVGPTAQLALANLRDPAVGPKLFKLAETNAELLNVLSRRAESATIPLWKPFLLTAEKKVRRTAWRNFKNMASDKTFAPLVAWLPQIQTDDVDGAVGALKASAKNVVIAERVRTLCEAWKECPSAGRTALAPVMALYADAAYEPLLMDGVTGTDAEVRRAATTALAAMWSDRAALVALFKAADDADRSLVVDLLFVLEGMETFAVLEGLFGDVSAGLAAKKAYVALYDRVKAGAADTAGKPLAREGWTATASANGNRANAAFDGKSETRWDTGHTPKEGEWFALDLGKSVYVSTVLLDTAKSPNDTPAGCDVFVSTDGKAWTGPVATCDDKSKEKTLFNLNVPVRHMKFVVKGGRLGLWWSIHEIEVAGGIPKDLLERLAAIADGLR
ncbi:MAG: ThuA domain-containing protein [bacterium]|nr:ThuA domain-containing protein [bacterium]